MASLKEMAIGRQDVFVLPLADIKIRDGWNARDLSTPENQEHVISLAQSVKAVGVLEPLIVEKEGDFVYVINGHCRFAAVNYANENLGAEIRGIPVRLVAKQFSSEERVLMQLTTNSGKNLSPFEAGKVCKQLLGWNWTEAQIAEKIGKSVATVRNYVDAANLPQIVQDSVNAGEISVSEARTIARKEGVAAVVDAVETGQKKFSDAAIMKAIFNFATVTHSDSEVTSLVIETEMFEWLKRKILIDKSSSKWDSFCDKHQGITYE